jgi:hypothetical protein
LPTEKPSRLGGDDTQKPGADRRDDSKRHQEGPGPAQISQPPRRHQPHLQQEESQHALEQVEEYPVQRTDALRPRQPADQEPARQQNDALAGQHLVQQGAPAHLALTTAGQENPHEQSWQLQQGEENGHVAIRRNATAGQKAAGHRKGHHADRTVMGRDGRRIGTGKTPYPEKHGEAGQGNQHGHAHHHQGGHGEIQHIVAGQFNAALQADGQQKKDAQGLVHDPRNLQIRTQEAGRQAKQEEENDGLELHEFHQSCRRSRNRRHARSMSVAGASRCRVRHILEGEVPVLQRAGDQQGFSALEAAIGIDDVEHGPQQTTSQYRILHLGQQGAHRLTVEYQLAGRGTHCAHQQVVAELVHDPVEVVLAKAEPAKQIPLLQDGQLRGINGPVSHQRKGEHTSSSLGTVGRVVAHSESP